MRLFVLRRNLALYWRKPLVRAAAVLLTTAGVVFAQYRLAHIPLPIQLESSSVKIPPVRLGEELVITDPDSKSNLLFKHHGDISEFSDVYLEKAIIAKETRSNYPLDFGSRSVADSIAYTTGSPGDSKIPCTTDFDARLEDGERAVGQIRFFQSSAGPGNESYRLLDVKADRKLVINVVTSPVPSGQTKPDSDSDDDGPGCVKLLDGGAFAGKGKTLSGAVVVKSDVPADSRITLRFLPSDASKPIWSGHDGLREPFLTPSPILVANKIQIRSVNGNSIPFEIVPVDKTTPLWVDKLKIGSDHLEVGIVGKGFVKVDGEVIPLEFFKLIAQYPFIAALFAMVNTGLLAWLARLVRSLLKVKAD